MGPAVAVPPKRWIHSIHRAGEARKSWGAPSTRSVPVIMGSVSRPTRPMSWYSGNHETTTSVSGSRRAAVAAASRLARIVRLGSITPLGSVVEPLVNWTMARESESGSDGSRLPPEPTNLPVLTSMTVIASVRSMTSEPPEGSQTLRSSALCSCSWTWNFSKIGRFSASAS